MSDVLFPLPRSIETQAGGPPPGAPVEVILDLSVLPQGYRLETDRDGIRVRHSDARGLRYAMQTLDQLRSSRSFGEVGYEIDDHPDFLHRGFLLDVSRDRVPTRRTLRRWVDLLSRARFTQLELYTEHTFAFRDHEEIWRDSSPLTAEDLVWLDARCAAAGIELVVSQNTFGHMERFLASPRYAHRAENPEGFERGGHQRPSTLEPTAQNVAFAQELLDEVTPLVRARRLNIGADEPFELGLGRSAPRVRAEGLGHVYFSHVEAIMAPWLARGYEVEFWADVFANHPELVHRVPEGAIPVLWQYDAPAHVRVVLEDAGAEAEAWRGRGADLDVLHEGFSAHARRLADAGRRFWVAPGTGTWNSVLGRLGNAKENMIDAAESGARYGAEGYLLTCWGDRGMWDAPSFAFGPALYGGAVSWCLEANRDVDLVRVLDREVFDDAAGVLGSVMVRLGELYRAFGVPLLNASPIARVLFPDDGLALPDLPSPAALDRVSWALDACRDELAAAEPAAEDGEVVLREIGCAMGLAELAVEVMRARHAGGETGIDAAHARRLLRRLEAAVAEQRACWALRSRPGGVEESLARIDPLRHELQRAAWGQEDRGALLE